MLILGDFGQMIKTKTPYRMATSLNQFAANMLPFAYLNVHFDPDIWSCHGCRIWTDPTVPSLQWQGGERNICQKDKLQGVFEKLSCHTLLMISCNDCNVSCMRWSFVSCLLRDFLKFQLVRKALDPQKTFARSKNPFCHTKLEMCLFIFSQYFTMLQPFECNA